MHQHRAGLMIAALLGSTAFSSAALAEPVELTILHINDLDRMEEKDGRGGFARLAAIFKAIAGESERVLLTHGGDFVSPSLMSGFDHGAHIVDLMNQLGLDAVTPGNHEFDFGPAVTAERFAEATFPIVSSNIHDPAGAGVPGTSETLMLEVGPFKVGVIGLTTPETVELSTTGDLVFDDPVETVERLGPELREAGANLVVAVAHTGVQEDLALVRSGAIDLLLSGHDHIIWSYYDGRAAGVEAYSQGEFVQELTITMDEVPNGDTTRFVWRPDFRTLDTADFEPDAEMAAAVQVYLDQLSTELDVKIGTSETALDSRRASVRSQETAIGNLFADAMRAAVDADIAITNGGGIRADKEYAAGTELTRRDIQSELPFGNRTVKLRLAGADILAALENGVSQVEDGAGRFPQVSGVSFSYDPAKPPGSRVVSVEVDGAPLDTAAEYTVATNDFMANGGDGYVAFGNGEVLIDANAGDFMANQVMEFVSAAGTIAPKVEGRITTAN